MQLQRSTEKSYRDEITRHGSLVHACMSRKEWSVEASLMICPSLTQEDMLSLRSELFQAFPGIIVSLIVHALTVNINNSACPYIIAP